MGLTYAGYGYWPSKLNRADGPTRDADPDPPDQDVPWWWKEICDGDFRRFDAWVKSLERAVAPQGIVELQERKKVEVDLRTGTEVRATTRKKGLEGRVESAPLEAAACPQDGGELSAEARSILESFPLKQFHFLGDSPDLSKAGALDLYSGKGGVARALVRGGCPWVLSFEINRSEREDLLLPENQERIVKLIELRAARLVGSAMVCKSFSRAVTPAVRNHQYPRGVPWMSANMKEKVKQGNDMADFDTLNYLRSIVPGPWGTMYMRSKEVSWFE